MSINQKNNSKNHPHTSPTISCLNLFLIFIFITLATLNLFLNLKGKRHQSLLPTLDQATCQYRLSLTSLDPEAICQLLVGRQFTGNFKLSETSTFQLQVTNQTNHTHPAQESTYQNTDFLITKIELPVTDFYSPLSTVSTSQISDPNFLITHQISLIDYKTLTATQKLLDIEGNYYLDHPDAGARFTILQISTEQAETISQLKQLLAPLSTTNLQQKQIITLAETGVTALTRRLTFKLNQVPSGAFFAENLTNFFKNKTYTHLSNEVSFTDNCQGSYQSMSLCADWRMLDSISSLGTNKIIELTGNHNNDTGQDNNLKTIAKYRALGYKIVGGGENLAQASTPLDLPESIRLLAYNHSTSSVANGQLATAQSPGANPYNEARVKQDIAEAKARQLFTIVNIQFFECYAYPNGPVAYPACDAPIQNQQAFFRHLIDLGADIVVGTSAHQPQTFELYQHKPIFYGLGNLFFDQIYWPDTRRSLILTHYFHDKHYLQTKISPTSYDETFQTRLLNSDEAITFLSRLINASPKGK